MNKLPVVHYFVQVRLTSCYFSFCYYYYIIFKRTQAFTTSFCFRICLWHFNTLKIDNIHAGIRCVSFDWIYPKWFIHAGKKKKKRPLVGDLFCWREMLICIYLSSVKALTSDWFGNWLQSPVGFKRIAWASATGSHSWTVEPERAACEKCCIDVSFSWRLWWWETNSKTTVS